jgi:hypothetical protein
MKTRNRWIGTLINLYELDDSRYWVDDVWNNRQFLIQAGTGRQIRQVLGRYLTAYDGYEPEDLDDLQSDYGKPVGYIPPDLPRPYMIRLFPLSSEGLVIE